MNKKFAAIIIDNRPELAERAADLHKPFLPSDWAIIHHTPGPEVKSGHDVNFVMTKKEFWEKFFEYDRVLIFQHDSGLLKRGIENFLAWDYVGAPWKFQQHGGNGGLSIRNPRAMADVCEKVPYDHKQHGNEDVYFVNHLPLLNCSVAPREVCETFAVESIYRLNTLGYHAIDRYLLPHECANILSQYMPRIEEMYKNKYYTPSDINQHLPTLANLATECEHITEMGVRDVVSTWAFLKGKPKALRCYDMHKSPNIDFALQQAELAGIDMKFTEADVLKVEIEETDMLFIDTLHQYTQLKNELALHAGRVRKYIVFHDVITYGEKPEPASWQTPEIMKNYVHNDRGLMPAIYEFLAANRQWKMKKMYTNNNGLLIIEKNG